MQESCRILKAFKINERNWMTLKAEEYKIIYSVKIPD